MSAAEATASRPIGAAGTQVRIARVLFARDLKSKLSAPGFYIVASAVCFVAAFASDNLYSAFGTESVMVSGDPLAGVNAMALGFLGIVLGLRAAVAVSWEREHQTLDVLLSGPVKPGAFVTAKLLAEIGALVLIAAIYTAYVLSAQPLGTRETLAAGVAAFWASSLAITPMIGFGILVSVASATVRRAVITYLVAAGVLGGIEVAAAWLNAQSANDLSLSALYARGTLNAVTAAIEWISPVSYLVATVEAALGTAMLTPARLAAAALWVVLAALAGIAGLRPLGAR